MALRGTPPPIVVTQADHDRLSDLASAALRNMPAVGEFLAEELDRARVVAPTEIAPTIVTMNSRVEFRDDQTGEVRTATLVYPGDQDIAAGKISILTPVGAALIGLEEGQSIVWETRSGAQKSLTVLKVLFQPEAQERQESALP
jgi:regulator of nucleoside diphosphate kinase